MLGRKDYTAQELRNARSAINAEVTSYRALLDESRKRGVDVALLSNFEAALWNNLALTLDRFFVHRLRSVTGKDTSALNELEIICESIMNNAGVLRNGNVIKYNPQKSIVKMNLGDKIELTMVKFEALANASFREIEAKFVAGHSDRTESAFPPNGL